MNLSVSVISADTTCCGANKMADGSGEQLVDSDGNTYWTLLPGLQYVWWGADKVLKCVGRSIIGPINGDAPSKTFWGAFWDTAATRTQLIVHTWESNTS